MIPSDYKDFLKLTPEEREEAYLEFERQCLLELEQKAINSSKYCILTPKKIADEMFKLFPDEIWNSSTKFFDPFSKSGIFLKYIDIKLWNHPRLKEEFPDDEERAMHIRKNQIYGFCPTQDCLNLSMYNSFASIHRQYNLRLIPDLVSIIKDKKRFRQLIEEVYGKEMKFDVILGNPPYQENTASIYQHFIEAGIDLAPKVCMITRNNWLTSDTLKSTRDRMINSGLKEVVNYAVQGELFPSVMVAVTIFNLDKTYSGTTKYTEIKAGKVTNSYSANFKGLPVIFKNADCYSIYQKIKNHVSKISNFGIHVLPTEPFRVATNGNVGRGASTYQIDDYDKKDNVHDVTLAYMNSSTKLPYYRYISKSDVPVRTEFVDTYKVLCGKVINNDDNCVHNVTLLNTHSICTSSWAVLFTGTNQQEVYNAGVYCRTKFFRFLVRLLCDPTMCGVSSYRFSLVPEQNYTNQSDIQWGQVKKVLDASDIKAVDDQLYKKYGLSDKEIEYIEKEMDYLK